MTFVGVLVDAVMMYSSFELEVLETNHSLDDPKDIKEQEGHVSNW